MALPILYPVHSDALPERGNVFGVKLKTHTRDEASEVVAKLVAKHFEPLQTEVVFLQKGESADRDLVAILSVHMDRVLIVEWEKIKED